MAINKMCHTCGVVTMHSSDGRCSACESKRKAEHLATLADLPLKDRVARLEKLMLELQYGPPRY